MTIDIGMDLPEAERLLQDITGIVIDRGNRLLQLADGKKAPVTKDEMMASAKQNESLVMDGLRDALLKLRPQARWASKAEQTIELPPGEWWAVDAVEGNVNLVHGTYNWGVSVTLLCDNRPMIAAFQHPPKADTYTSIRGGGSFLNGQQLQVSKKYELDAAIVATSQAKPGQKETYSRIGQSIEGMLEATLLVDTSVPTTFPMLSVAAGKIDGFWLYGADLEGVAGGALFVQEAGGVVTRIDGTPWQPGSPDILAAAPALHAGMRGILAAF